MGLRRFCAVFVAAVGAVLFFLSSAAVASPWVRDCGTAQDGSLTGNLQWETTGPWHVGMSAATARSIALRTRPEEFQPAGSHPAARGMPCWVAQSVATTAANAWTHWPGNSGIVGIRPEGYTPGPYLGRFVCSGSNRRGGGARERCVHSADRHAGAITVTFVVKPAPSG